MNEAVPRKVGRIVQASGGLDAASEALGVSRKQVKRWLKGRDLPTLAQAREIERRLPALPGDVGPSSRG